MDAAPTLVTKLNGQTLSTPQVTTYSYDAAGNKVQEVLSNGVTTVYSYDDLNRLTDVVETVGAVTLFSEHYVLKDNGSRASSNETQRQTDGTTETIASTWSYDDLNRLIGESVTSSVAAHSFADTYSFDLASNRISDVHTGAGGNETISYTYNANDELVMQVSSLHGETDFGYDPNGSLTSQTNGTNVTMYSYDVRGKLVSVTVNGTVTARYAYDDAGNRVSETVGSVTTLYLIDTRNTTGYAQPLEAKNASDGTVKETYLPGDRVFGQVDGSGNVSYLLVDGHGSTRLLTDASGTVTAVFNYDAFGKAVNFNAAMATTPFLFGGDSFYDPASGLNFHGDGVRTRSGFMYMQSDFGPLGQGNKNDPISLHKYLYVGANPISYYDPSGHDIADDLAGALGGGLAATGAVLLLSFIFPVAAPVFAVALFAGVIVGGGTVEFTNELRTWRGGSELTLDQSLGLGALAGLPIGIFIVW